MNTDFVVMLAQESVRTMLMVSGPLVLLAMVVGLVVSIIQAATQVQEMTLVFVPKMLVVFAGIVVFATFMLDTMARFTTMIFELVSRGSGL
jgi:flagellar biosynthesis protein FliQ